MTTKVTWDNVAQLGPEAWPVSHPHHNEVLGGLLGSRPSLWQGGPRTNCQAGGRPQSLGSSNLAAYSSNSAQH